MFEKLKTRLRRVMSSGILSPASMPRQRVEDSLMEVEAAVECMSPSKSLRRTAAMRNLHDAAAQDRQPWSSPSMSARSPRTPQHRSPISRKEGKLNGWLSSTPDNEDLSFAMPGSYHTTPICRLSNASTVIINRTEMVGEGHDSEFEGGADEYAGVELEYAGAEDEYAGAEDEYADAEDEIVDGEYEDEPMNKDKQDMTGVAYPQHRTDSVYEQKLRVPSSSSTVRHKASEEYSNYKTNHKRACTSLREITSDYDEEDVRPQKRLRSDSDSTVSDLSVSPSPRYKLSTTRHPIVPRLVHSQPELARSRRESIENDLSHHAGEKVGRRVWSADDVLHALRNGRHEVEDASKTTPPTSPILSPTTLQKEEYTLHSPTPRPLRLNREPLVNITDKFVPTFLQAPEPELQPLVRPPTPGSTWHLHGSPGLHVLTKVMTSSPTLLGLDGASDSKVADADDDKDDAKSVVSFTSSLSASLYDADETGRPAQPNIRHVLRGLDSDAKFLQDALNQIKALRNKVAKYHKRARRTRQSIGEATEEDELEGQKVMAKYLREARECEELARRAREYRREAGELVRNAMAEAEMIRGLDEEGGDADGDMEELSQV